jgi:hypothetical protein
MKIIKKVCICSILIFSACGNPTNNKNSNQEASASAKTQLILEDNFYKKLKGKIGDNMFITMDLIRRKDSTLKVNNVSGYYYYDKIGMPLNIYGSVSDSGKFELVERNKKGDETGIFRGEFINANEVKGIWVNPETKKEFPFDLTAVVANSTQFDFFEFYNENCRSRVINLKSSKKDTLNWSDTLCSSVNVSLIALQNTGDKTCRKINDCIMKTLLSMGTDTAYTTIHELTHSIDDLRDFNVVVAEYATRIVSNENNVLCISVSYWANTGGPHPNGNYFFLNFDTRTGDTLSLLDVVLPETIDELVNISKKQFIKENGSIKEVGWFFDEGEFKMPQSFSISKGGLLFVYQTYEAGPYMMGMPQFFIPYKELKGIVKPEYLKL